MNKSHLAFLAILFTVCFISCSDKEQQFSNPTLYPVCIQLKTDVEVLPFPATKSMPDAFPPEPLAAESSEESEETSLFNRIAYVVFDQESGAVVKNLMLTPDNSDDFGAYVYDELEAGSYLIALIAHSQADASLTGDQFSGTDVTDAFHAVCEVEVSAESEDNPVEVVLKRVVSRVEFVGLKEVPAEAARFILEVTRQYHGLHVKTGNAADSQILRKEYSLTADSKPDDSPVYSFYTFIPEPLAGDTSKLERVRLITLDADADTLYAIELTSIPVLKNRITRYSGSLYAPKENKHVLELEIEDYGQWKDTIDISF